MLTKQKIREILKNSKADYSEKDVNELYNLGSTALVKKRAKGVPLQYILKQWEFYSLPIIVNKGVLIPRPDTETLVDIALNFLKPGQNVLDVCSGSGAIAIAIAKNVDVNVFAIEKSPRAFKYLKQNIALNNANVVPLKKDALNLKKALKKCPVKKFDLLVSNPPYISKFDYKQLQKEVKHEPKMALVPKKDELIFYKKITAAADSILTKNGKILFEVGYNQSGPVKAILQSFGYTAMVYKDYTHIERAVLATKTN